MHTLTWAPISPYGIDKAGAGRFSGRVADVLLWGDAVVIATSFGGVWTISTDVTVLTGFETRSLSDGWDDPDMACLAHGPDDDRQIYAGASRTLYYFELVNAGGAQAGTTVVLPLPFTPRTVSRIVVDKSARRIVIGTGAGVWFSTIPSNPADAGGYAWQQATGLPGSKIGGLCAGDAGAVHASVWGSGEDSSDAYGIFRGTFAGGALTFTRSGLHWLDGGSEHNMTRVSLGSCAGSLEAAYAGCSDKDKNFRGVLQYDAAADRWNDVLNASAFASAARTSQPGGQGTFNNVIAVAPDNADRVAFGWQMGTFVRHESGWVMLDNPMSHHDVHGLCWQPVSGGHDLYIGSDGGILKVSGPAKASPVFDDRLNTFLPTLLFSHTLRNQYATIDVSPTVDGLVSGGLQDNGIKYLKTATSSYTSWEHIQRFDGGTNVFLANGILICRDFNASSAFRFAKWNVSAQAFDATVAIPTDVKVTDDPRMEVCARVVAPHFRNSAGELMHAVCAAVQDEHAGGLAKGTNIVVGLFGNDALTKFHWSVIGTTPSAVTAIGSYSGDSVLLGLDDGSLVTLNVAGFLGHAATFLSKATLPALPPGQFLQFELLSSTLTFALFDGKTSGAILVDAGHAWQTIPLPVSDLIYSFAIDDHGATIYFATDTAVYQGAQIALSAGVHPVGFNTAYAWVDNSNGLPSRMHATHLRLGRDLGTPYLYLATYGHAVYRASTADDDASWPNRILGSAKAGVTVLFGVVQDGGGIEIDPHSGKIIIVPPRQPEEAVLAALFTSQRLAGNAKASAERRAALEVVQRYAESEIKATR
jgi:hypothetical protein